MMTWRREKQDIRDEREKRGVDYADTGRCKKGVRIWENRKEK